MPVRLNPRPDHSGHGNGVDDRQERKLVPEAVPKAADLLITGRAQGIVWITNKMNPNTALRCSTADSLRYSSAG